MVKTEIKTKENTEHAELLGPMLFLELDLICLRFLAAKMKRKP